MKKSLIMIAAATVSVLAMAGMAMAGEKITVAASPTPHAEILEKAKDVLAEEGYDLEVIEFEEIAGVETEAAAYQETEASAPDETKAGEKHSEITEAAS